MFLCCKLLLAEHSQMRIHAPVSSIFPCRSVLAFLLIAAVIFEDMNAAAYLFGVLLDVAAAAAAFAAAAVDAYFDLFVFGV